MEITKDMRDAAKEAADYCGIGAYSTMRQFIEDVAANAIRDERERCVRIAENRFTPENVSKTKKGKISKTGSIAIIVCGCVARAIQLQASRGEGTN